MLALSLALNTETTTCRSHMQKQMNFCSLGMHIFALLGHSVLPLKLEAKSAVAPAHIQILAHPPGELPPSLPPACLPKRPAQPQQLVRVLVMPLAAMLQPAFRFCWHPSVPSSPLPAAPVLWQPVLDKAICAVVGFVRNTGTVLSS